MTVPLSIIENCTATYLIAVSPITRSLERFVRHQLNHAYASWYIYNWKPKNMHVVNTGHSEQYSMGCQL